MSTPRVLFLCTANSARSQLAEALLRHHAAARFEACSAGTVPSHVHPMTLQVLTEAGVSTLGLWSKSIEQALELGPVEHAFAVCAAAGDNCPALLDAGVQVVAWPFDDPARVQDEHAQIDVFRQTKSVIEARILSWLDQQA